MRGVASIRTETHLCRFLHGIRLFCNAHSPPKALSPQNLFLSQKHAPIFQSTLLPLAIRASIALFRCAQYGLLSPYFAALNTGSCYAIAPRGAMRSAAPAMCSLLRRLRAYAYATRPYCRCQYGLLSPYFAALNTGQSNTIHPIHIKMII